MTTFFAGTATNAGTYTFDLYDIWRGAFAQEWHDLGMLVHIREHRLPIDEHRPFLPGPCACFSCRVYAAWKAYHSDWCHACGQRTAPKPVRTRRRK
jgi:hypothetical protein